MKKIIYAILPAFVLGISLTFSSCDQKKDSKDKSDSEQVDDESDDKTFTAKSLKGKWEITNVVDAMNLDQGGVYDKIKANGTINFKGNKFTIDVDFEGTMIPDGTNKMKLGLAICASGPFEVDDDIVTIAINDADYDITKLDLDPELEGMLEMQGMTKDDLISQLRSGMDVSSMANGVEENMEVSDFKGKSLVLTGDRGTVMKLKKK